MFLKNGSNPIEDLSNMLKRANELQDNLRSSTQNKEKVQDFLEATQYTINTLRSIQNGLPEDPSLVGLRTELSNMQLGSSGWFLEFLRKEELNKNTLAESINNLATEFAQREKSQQNTLAEEFVKHSEQREYADTHELSASKIGSTNVNEELFNEKKTRHLAELNIQRFLYIFSICIDENDHELLQLLSSNMIIERFESYQEFHNLLITMCNANKGGDIIYSLLTSHPNLRTITYHAIEGTVITPALSKLSPTLLHVAVSRGNEKLVKLLLEQGVDLSICDKMGQNPMHVSATNKILTLPIPICKLTYTPVDIETATRIDELLRAQVKSDGKSELLLKKNNLGSGQKFNKNCLDLAKLYKFYENSYKKGVLPNTEDLALCYFPPQAYQGKFLLESFTLRCLSYKVLMSDVGDREKCLMELFNRIKLYIDNTILSKKKMSDESTLEKIIGPMLDIAACINKESQEIILDYIVNLVQVVDSAQKNGLYELASQFAHIPDLNPKYNDFMKQAIETKILSPKYIQDILMRLLCSYEDNRLDKKALDYITKCAEEYKLNYILMASYSFQSSFWLSRGRLLEVGNFMPLAEQCSKLLDSDDLFKSQDYIAKINFNHASALASLGKFEEALPIFIRIKKLLYENDAIVIITKNQVILKICEIYVQQDKIDLLKEEFKEISGGAERNNLFHNLFGSLNSKEMKEMAQEFKLVKEQGATPGTTQHDTEEAKALVLVLFGKTSQKEEGQNKGIELQKQVIQDKLESKQCFYSIALSLHRLLQYFYISCKYEEGLEYLEKISKSFPELNVEHDCIELKVYSFIIYSEMNHPKAGEIWNSLNKEEYKDHPYILRAHMIHIYSCLGQNNLAEARACFDKIVKQIDVEKIEELKSYFSSKEAFPQGEDPEMLEDVVSVHKFWQAKKDSLREEALKRLVAKNIYNENIVTWLVDGANLTSTDEDIKIIYQDSTTIKYGYITPKVRKNVDNIWEYENALASGMVSKGMGEKGVKLYYSNVKKAEGKCSGHKIKIGEDREIYGHQVVEKVENGITHQLYLFNHHGNHADAENYFDCHYPQVEVIGQ